MQIAFPDYKNCGLNVTSSIMKYFGTPCPHATLPFLDQMFEQKKYRNVVLMLFDGMGMDALSHDLSQERFFNTHTEHILSAVFPSTTTAATTSIECAVSPAEHGWLGWTLYFHEIDKAVDIFINRVQGTKEQAADYSVVNKYLPIDSVFHRITEAGKAKAFCLSPFSDPPLDTLDAIGQAIREKCAEKGSHYLYAYWGDPDHTMHEKGVYSDEVKEKISGINDFVQELTKALSDDTLVLVTADHGLIDANHLFVSDDPQLAAMLVRPPTVESRVAAFYVKPECKAEFPKSFYQCFSRNFILMTGREFIESGILGPGHPNKKLSDLTGDFIAIATDHDCIDYSREGTLLRGVHAGLTKNEMLVPLIVAKK